MDGEEKSKHCNGKRDDNNASDDGNPSDHDDKEKQLPPPALNDFVIRDGFPALRQAGGNHNHEWMIDGVEPIPKRPIWACTHAIHFTHESLWRHDCETVFSARTRDSSSQAYSTGTTYFCPALMQPRCALEDLALSIFHRHTSHLEAGVVIPELSGAEWWTLVLDHNNNDDDDHHQQQQPSQTQPQAVQTTDEDGERSDDDDESESDEVGLHFDADYGLEDQAPHLLLHPRLATVTYLSSHGAPTLILDQKSPPPDDADLKKTLDQRSIRRAWLSHPSTGKHLAFDGRLLHGAPATFFPCANKISKAKVQGQGLDPAKTAITTLSVREHSTSRDVTSTPNARGDDDNDDDDGDSPPDCKRPKLDAALALDHHNVSDTRVNASAHEDKRITVLVNIWINHCPLDAEPLEDEICESLKTPYKRALSGPTHNTNGKETKDSIDAKLQLQESNSTQPPQQKPGCFTWNIQDLDKSASPTLCSVHLQSCVSVNANVDPAGEEEFILCNRLVTAKYGASRSDLHECVELGHDCDLTQLELDDGVIELHVGDLVPEEKEDEDDIE